MARTGTCEFQHSTFSPVQHDGFYRDVINRQHWDHSYHALRENVPRCSYKNLSKTSTDLHEPWGILSRAHVPKHMDEGGLFLTTRQNVTSLGLHKSRSQGLIGTTTNIAARASDPRTVISHALPRSFRAASMSSTLPYIDRLAVARGEDMTDNLKRHHEPALHKRPGGAGWSGPDRPTISGPPRYRAPSHTRLFNA